MGYNSVADNRGLSPFFQPLLPPKHEKCREIRREFELTAVQGDPRSSILVSMESPYVTSYQSLIVTLTVSATVFEIFTVKDRKLLILPTPPLFDAPQWRNAMKYRRNLYTAEKCIILVGYNSVADIIGLSSFVQPWLPPKVEKSREIPTKFDLTPVQGHPRSSILVSIEGPCTTSYQSLIVTLAVSATVFEILTLKARQSLNFSDRPLFEAPVRGEPLRIW